MAVTVGGGLDALVAQVALDYRHRDTGLDKPAGVGVPEIMQPGLFGEALAFGPGPSRLPDIGVEVMGPDRSIVTTTAPTRIGEHPLPRQVELGQDAGSHVNGSGAAPGLGWPQLVTLTGHIAPRSPDVDGALSQIDLTGPQGGGFSPPSATGNQEFDQGLPRFGHTRQQNGELLVGQEDHLGGCIAA